MAHGAPDFYGTSPQGLVHRVADLAELAARLGSPVTFDRRGNVLFMDSFDNGGAGWNFIPSGGVAAGYPLADPVHFGGLSIGIYTDAVAGAASSWYKFVPLPLISNFGLEIAFGLPFDTRDIKLSFVVWTGAKQYLYDARWQQPGGNLYVRNSTFAWQLIATPGPLYTDGTTWYIMKLVANPLTGYYTRLIFNAVSYDISTIAAYSTPDATAPTCEITFNASGNLAASRLFPFDDLIFTLNE